MHTCSFRGQKPVKIRPKETHFVSFPVNGQILFSCYKKIYGLLPPSGYTVFVVDSVTSQKLYIKHEHTGM